MPDAIALIYMWVKFFILLMIVGVGYGQPNRVFVRKAENKEISWDWN